MIITHKYILPSLILPLQSKQYEDEASAVVHLPHVDQRKRLWLDPRKAMHIVTVCQEVMSKSVKTIGDYEVLDQAQTPWPTRGSGAACGSLLSFMRFLRSCQILFYYGMQISYAYNNGHTCPSIPENTTMVALCEFNKLELNK